MKAALVSLGVLAALIAIAFVARPTDRVLAEKKIDGRECRVIWRYSPFSLTRESGELLFVSLTGAQKKEVSSGFHGDWSGNSVIEWKELPSGVLEASDRFSGKAAAFHRDGLIEVIE